MYSHKHCKQLKNVILLEDALGSPKIASNLLSYEKVIALDEFSKFPVEQANLLFKLGIQKYFVPSESGGYLESFEELSYIFRSIFRRDITLGLGFGVTTFMAVIHIYLFGSAELKKRITNIILNGNTISVAYHEKEHGSDLMDNELNAFIHDDRSYKIFGKKWLINNIETSEGYTVFARTSSQGGGRGFSLFFVEKNKIHPTELIFMPKIKTHGVKGCRIAGIEFRDTQVLPSDVIGKIGEGVELTLKGFQVTRTLLPGMSIGAADTALRCVIDFSNNRHLYGNKITEIPHVYETLTDAYIQLLICDCISTASARCLHVITEQMSVISAITKFSVPKTIQALLKHLSVILGARNYLRDGPYAIFQKIIRDYPIVSLGHSSDVICVNTILPQLKLLLSKTTLSKNFLDSLENIFSLGNTLPIFKAENLKISNNGYNDIINSLHLIPSFLDEKINLSKCDSEIVDNVKKLIGILDDILGELKVRSINLKTQIQDFSKETYGLVELYCNIFSVTCCVWIWIFNFSKISNFFDNGIWLIIAINQLFPEIIIIKEANKKSYTRSTFNYLQNLFLNDLSFSLVPIRYL
jgi:alkylation response protein AidB-like acyl-CoA dehydrogenase